MSSLYKLSILERITSSPVASARFRFTANRLAQFCHSDATSDYVCTPLSYLGVIPRYLTSDTLSNLGCCGCRLCLLQSTPQQNEAATEELAEASKAHTNANRTNLPSSVFPAQPTGTGSEDGSLAQTPSALPAPISVDELETLLLNKTVEHGALEFSSSSGVKLTSGLAKYFAQNHESGCLFKLYHLNNACTSMHHSNNYFVCFF